MNIPSTLRIGDTWSWTDSLDDYPSPTWTLKYALRKHDESVIDITGTEDGTDHSLDVTAAVSAGYVPGEYAWSAFVEDGSGASLERHTVGSGTVKLLPSIHAATSATDLRTYAQKMLDAIEAVMFGRATHADLSLTINGKAIQYMKPKELREERAYFQSEVAKEQRAESGKNPGRRIMTRFGP
jgi:hypothetical protein